MNMLKRIINVNYDNLNKTILMVLMKFINLLNNKQKKFKKGKKF